MFHVEYVQQNMFHIDMWNMFMDMFIWNAFYKEYE